MSNKKICAECNREFTAEHKNTILCSDECRKERRNDLQNAKNKETPPKSRYTKRRTFIKVCVMCDAEFETNSYKKKTCGDICSYALRDVATLKKKGKNTTIAMIRVKPINPKYLVRNCKTYAGYTSL